jgi:hypothetical protein
MVCEEDWGNVGHYFADEKEKEIIKQIFGITQVPYLLVINAVSV